jgi:hypothetical protein
MAPVAMPVFGDKSHISTDRRHGFIRRWSVTDAARHDGRVLPGLLDRTNTAAPVWADTASRSRENERRIDDTGLGSKAHFRRAPGEPTPRFPRWCATVAAAAPAAVFRP